MTTPSPLPPSSPWWKRRRNIFLMTLSATSVLMLSVTPTLLQTEWGKNRVVSYINNRISGELSIESLTFGWTTPLEAEGIILKDPTGTTVATIPKVASSKSLWGALGLFRINFNDFTITSPKLSVLMGSDGANNLATALAPKNPIATPTEPETDIKNFTIQELSVTHVTNGQLTLSVSDKEPLIVSGISLSTEKRTANSDGIQSTSFTFAAATRQAEQQGHIEGAVTLQGATEKNAIILFESNNGLFSLSKGSSITASLSASKFSSDLLDTVLSFNKPAAAGFVRELTGDTLTTRLECYLGRGYTADQPLTDDSTLSLSFTSDNASFNEGDPITFSYNTDKLTLDTPFSASCSISHNLLTTFCALMGTPSNFAIGKTIQASVTCDRLQIPFNPLFSPADTGIDAKCTLAKGDIQELHMLNAWAIKDVAFDIDKVATDPELYATLKAKGTYAKKKSDISLKIHLQDLFTPTGSVQLSRAKGEVSIDANNIPVAFLDSALNARGALTDAFGDAVQIQASRELIPGAQTYSLKSIKGKEVDIKGVSLTIGNDIRLVTTEDPSRKHKLFVPPALVSAVFGAEGLSLSQPTPARLILRELAFPRGSVCRQGEWPYNSLIFDGELEIDNVTLENCPALGAITLANLEIGISGNLSESATLKARAGLQSATPAQGTPPFFATLFKKSGQLTLSGTIEGLKGCTFQMKNLVGTVKSAEYSLEMTAHYDAAEQSILTLDQPLTLSFKLTPDGFRSLFRLDASLPTIQEAANVQVSFAPGPLTIYQPQIMCLMGNATIDKLQISKNEAMTNINAAVALDGPANTATFSITTAESTTPIIASTLQGWHGEDGINFGQAELSASINWNPIPPHIAGAIAGFPLLHKILGDAGSLTGAVSLGKDHMGTGNLSLKGEYLDASTRFRLDHGLLVTDLDGTSVDWRIVPEVLAAAQRDYNTFAEKNGYDVRTPLILTEPLPIALRIAFLRFPLLREWHKIPDTSPLRARGAVGTLTVSAFNITDDEGLFSCDGGEFSLDASSLDQAISFQGNIKGRRIGGEHEAELSINSRLTGLEWSEDGYSQSNTSAIIEVSATNLPATTLARMLTTNPKTVDTVDSLAGSLIYSGSIQADIDKMETSRILKVTLESDRSALHLDGAMANGYLQLLNDATLSCTLSRRLSQLLTDDLSPLLICNLEADESHETLTAVLKAEGFAFPLGHWDIKNLTVGELAINPGHIKLDTTPMLRALITVLEPDQGRDTMDVWFTPLYINIKDGIVTQNRCDLQLLERYPIAAWGNIDLANEQILDFTLGISGLALKRGRAITTIPDDEFLQLYLKKGPTSNPKFDEKKVLSCIVALIAESKGGLAGLLFAKILREIHGAPPAPPPTTTPFPWNQSTDQ